MRDTGDTRKTMNHESRLVNVALGERSYKIIIDDNILEEIGDELRVFGFSPKMAIVSNPTVFHLYGQKVLNSIRDAGFNVSYVLIPDGEEYKDFHWLHYILGKLLRLRLDRKSAIVALGGGVIGDITGFAASTYMRGIGYIQMPTTLLSQVDSSVGGKTGVNHPLGKNMIGTFYQPRLVWIDTATLRTLYERELLTGISEIIKYGIIRDKALFDFLWDNRDAIVSLESRAIEHLIKKSCQIKADVVSRDERESGLRAILNYGHTIGHAIEALTGYKKYLHGEAVAIGMHIEARLAASMSLLSNGEVDKIRHLIEAYRLPAELPPDIDRDTLMNAMRIDKKAVSGNMKFALPERIGSVRIAGNIEKEMIKQAL